MPIDPSARGWDAKQSAKVAEFNEAQAYAALARAAALQGAARPVAIDTVADGLALRSDGDRSTTLFNRVIGLGLERRFDADTLAAVAAKFANCEGPWGLELAPPATHEGVRGLLKQLQLRRGLSTAMLAMDCADLTGDRPTWRIQRGGLEDGEVAAEMIGGVFGVSHAVTQILRHAPQAGGFTLWMAYEGERPVATSLTHIRGEAAWFGWAATLPSHRKRGLQSALLWHGLRDARERGCRWMTAETAIGTLEMPDASYRNMRRFGFVELYRRHGYLRVPRRTLSRAA